MALVAYDDSGSEDNEEKTEDYNRPAVVSKTEKPTVKIGLPFNNLVGLRQSGSSTSLCIPAYTAQSITPLQ